MGLTDTRANCALTPKRRYCAEGLGKGGRSRNSKESLLIQRLSGVGGAPRIPCGDPVPAKKIALIAPGLIKALSPLPG